LGVLPACHCAFAIVRSAPSHCTELTPNSRHASLPRVRQDAHRERPRHPTLHLRRGRLHLLHGPDRTLASKSHSRRAKVAKTVPDRAKRAAEAWQVPDAMNRLVEDEGKHELAQHLRIAHLNKHAITIEQCL
jgi:hypothetical protein